MPPATKWDDAMEKRFLLELLERGGTNAGVMAQIAEKWGEPHTVGSLGMKLARLRKAYAKENGGEVVKAPIAATSAAKPKKGRSPKRKADTPIEGSDDDEVAEKPKKKSKASKGSDIAGNVKLEQDLDEF